MILSFYTITLKTIVVGRDKISNVQVNTNYYTVYNSVLLLFYIMLCSIYVLIVLCYLCILLYNIECRKNIIKSTEKP